MLLLAIGTACASMGAIVLELGPVKNMQGWPKALHLGLTILTVVDSWLFMHLTFAFHYAHEYYDEAQAFPDRKPEERGGLIFPGAAPPGLRGFPILRLCDRAGVADGGRFHGVARHAHFNGGAWDAGVLL